MITAVLSKYLYTKIIVIQNTINVTNIEFLSSYFSNILSTKTCQHFLPMTVFKIYFSLLNKHVCLFVALLTVTVD